MPHENSNLSNQAPGRSQKSAVSVTPYMVFNETNFDLPFLQSCVIYRLEGGRIVYQQAVSSTDPKGPCSKSSQELARIIHGEFSERGKAMCCRFDGCNKDIPADFLGQTKSYLFLEDLRGSARRRRRERKLAEGERSLPEQPQFGYDSCHHDDGRSLVEDFYRDSKASYLLNTFFCTNGSDITCVDTTA